MKHLNKPLIAYIIISTVSLIVSVLLFFIGDSVARFVEANEALGISIEAGGAIAGFLIVFHYSQRAVIKFQKMAENDGVRIKVFLMTQDGPFERQGEKYKCKCVALNQQTGDRNEVILEPFWEAGHLAVIIKDVMSNEFISLHIICNDEKWETDFFSPATHTMELN